MSSRNVVPDVSAQPFLSIVVPTLNEERCISAFIERVGQTLSRLAPSWEIVVVDDGSTDSTRSIVALKALEDPRIRLISGKHSGKGAAIRQGMLAALGRWRFMADADLAMPPDNLSRFINAANAVNPPDIVIGSREGPGAERIGESPLRHVIGRVFNWIVRAIAVNRIRDTQCGFKPFSAAAAETVFPHVTITGFAFDVEVLFLARRARLDIREKGIVRHGRSDSRVSIGRGAAAFMDVLRIRWRWRRAFAPGGPPSVERAMEETGNVNAPNG